MDCLFSLLHNCSLTCRAHQGQSRSCQQFDVNGCDQSSFVAALSLPALEHGKTDHACKIKIRCRNGSMQHYLDTPHLLSVKKNVGHNVECHNHLPLGILIL